MSNLPTADLPTVTRITPALSPALRQLLDGKAAHELTPALVEEARAVLPVLLSAARQPAGLEGVQDVLGRRFVTYPQPSRSEGEWAAWWDDYHEVLKDVPWGDLDAAMVEYMKGADADFMPKPGKLLALAQGIRSKAWRAYCAAREIVDDADRPTGTFELSNVVEFDPVERENMKAKFEQLLQDMRNGRLSA